MPDKENDRTCKNTLFGQWGKLALSTINNEATVIEAYTTMPMNGKRGGE